MRAPLPIRPPRPNRRAPLGAPLGWVVWGALTCVLLLAAAPLGAQADDYVVIVHPDVPVDRLTAAELGRLFQRRTTQWSDGTQVMPVEEVGPLRARFYRDTMRMSVAEVGNYWVRQAMTAGVQPPRLLGSADLVIAYVAATPGAVAFVEASAHLGTRVKRIAVD
jgi:ABC-type phosphate transport system substrate-binding protein